MKKFLIILLFLISTNVVFSAEYPRWVAQPIYVYVPEYGNFTQLMKKAFSTWQNQSKNLVRFSFVNSSSSAQIHVEFVDFVTNCSGHGHAVGCTQLATRGKNYYKSVVTIGTKEYARVYDGLLYTSKLQYRKENNIYGVMLHEIGHALGLGHSDDNQSIMYPYDLPTMQYLTNEDMRLLYNKYH